jgi:alkanesulfonate monooxygenase SsuD/methylene tetrahydromethanopterin reductase-like flavin-dependent oxidoreductase (luciferase family)
MRRLWREDSPTYAGAQIAFPPLRCEPKPVQEGGPPFLLGGHGEKALERIARSYDGWCPIVSDPADFGREVAELRERMRAHGRNPDNLLLSPFVDPEQGRLAVETLRAYRAAGARRLVMFYASQTDAVADGAAPFLEEAAAVVARARDL